MKPIILILYFFLLLPAVFGQRKVSIYMKEANRGRYCYLLWTSDTTKCNPGNTKTKLHLDNKNIVYIHFSMLKGDSIRIFSDVGQNISKQMINIMKSDEYLYFYYPTKNELKKNPHYDSYYAARLIKLRGYLPGDFKKMGYKLESLK